MQTSDYQYSSRYTSITLVFLICLFGFASSQNPFTDTLSQGDSVTFNSQLVSSGRNFTLGFYTPDRTNNSYVAIWYTDAPSTSFPVWIGNRNNPVPNNSTPNMSISNTGSLVINYGSGENPIELYTGEGSTQNVSATLLESGNFVLRQVTTDGSEVVLWQSFDYPTDTLLPGMRLGINHRTGRNWTLTSWFGENNPASGAFTLEWDFTTNRLLVRRRSVVYWTSGEMRDHNVEPGNLRVREFVNMQPPDPWNWNYNFTNITSSDEQYFIYSLLIVPDNTPDFRAVVSGWRLEYLGDIRDYRRDGLQLGLALVSTCYGYNTTQGCELRAQPTCNDRRQSFELRAGGFGPVNGRSPDTIYDNSTTISLSDCRELCWNDCECAGFWDLESGCVRYRGRNLRFEQSLDGTTNANRIYVLQSRAPNNRSRTPLEIIIPVVVGTLLLILIVALILLRRFKRRKQEEDMHELLTLEGYTDAYEPENGGTKGHDLRLFSYASIVSATHNFSSDHKLGEGGFGPVYKGRTPEGHEIAVKLLSRSSGQGLLEFKTELILISKLQHVNLVKLVGFSVHGEDKMIVYEYMPNKSLDFFLFDQSKREKLDWGRRFNIIEGISQGLLYLHKYSRFSIVHRDMKCSNILLDENLNPKIADFGLARIFKQDTDEANTNRRVGTYGYMAPEYAMQGIFSFKSDIYSFGVLVPEIVSGRKNSSFHHIEGPLNLVEYAWELWCKDSAQELMDPILTCSCKTDQLQRCINIALLCVENRAIDRPSIEDVLLMLKNETTTLPLPKNPSFITRNSVVAELGKTTGDMPSMNEVSISEMTGR